MSRMDGIMRKIFLMLHCTTQRIRDVEHDDDDDDDDGEGEDDGDNDNDDDALAVCI